MIPRICGYSFIRVTIIALNCIVLRIVYRIIPIFAKMQMVKLYFRLIGSGV